MIDLGTLGTRAENVRKSMNPFPTKLYRPGFDVLRKVILVSMYRITGSLVIHISSPLILATS